MLASMLGAPLAYQGLQAELPLYEKYPGAHEAQNVACPCEIVPAGQVCSHVWRKGKDFSRISMNGRWVDKLI